MINKYGIEFVSECGAFTDIVETDSLLVRTKNKNPQLVMFAWRGMRPPHINLEP